MKPHILLIALLALALGCATLCAEPNETVTGTVVASDTNEPIVGAVVVFAEQTGSLTVRPQIVLATTGEGGHFNVNLPNGKTFSACVHNAGHYLDPCVWSKPPSVEAVGQGEPLLINLQPGTILDVEILDPAGVFDGMIPADLVVQAPPIQVQLTGPSSGNSIPVPFVTRSRGMVEYRTAVPLDADWKVVLTTSAVHLRDGRGQSYTSGTPVAIPAASRPSNQSTPGRIPAGNESVIAFTVEP